LDRDVAEAAAKRALELNPGSAYGWYASGHVHAFRGKARAALSDLETHFRLDPRSPWRASALDALAVAFFSLRRFDEVVVVSREVCDLLPGMKEAYAPYIASALAHAGRLDEAREIVSRVGPEMQAEWVETWVSLLAPADRELVISGLAMARA
jgi:hypothetical protein